MASIPSEGPCRERDDRPCRVLYNFKRQRRTGPSFPLTVVRCTTHGCSFTLYPPGSVPYGRQAVVIQSPCGHRPSGAARTPGQTIADLFEGTLFQSGLDAATGQAWYRDCPGGTERWWPNQTRTLSKLLRLLGVDPSMTEAERERLSRILEVDLLFLIECGDRVASRPGYRHRGKAIRSVLERVIESPCILERLLLSGYQAGLWGYPLMWDPASGVLRSSPFPVRDSRSPPR